MLHGVSFVFMLMAHVYKAILSLTMSCCFTKPLG